MSADASPVKSGANILPADPSHLDARFYSADDFANSADSMAGSGALSHPAPPGSAGPLD
jgi:hypothetical protein